MANRNVWIGIGIVIIAVVVAAGVYVYSNQMTSPHMTPLRNVTLYEGDQVVGGSVQGVFGLTENSMTSPGPTLNLTVGDVVNITVYNVGSIPHNWAIVDAKSNDGQVTFNAHVATGNYPLTPGSSASDIFEVTQAGNYYYISQVTGDLDSGMWGNVVVSGY